MANIPYLQMTLAVFAVALACSAAQKFFRKYLDPDQYYYLKDITLIGIWALFGIWTPNPLLRVTIAASAVSGCIGFCQKVTNKRWLRFLYFLTGFAFAVFGPRIAFIEAQNGEFLYLSNITSILICTAWVGVMPLFFQEIDEIPGMCGLFLALIWGLISVVIITAPQHIQDITQMCIMGIIFLLVFWSRHLNAYRRLTEPLSAFWGTLVAGVIVFAISRGIATYSVISITAGMLLLPALEITVSLITALFSRYPGGSCIIYRKLIGRGINHAEALHAFAFICASLACLLVYNTLHKNAFFVVLGVVFAIFAASVVLFKFKKQKSAETTRRPCLWGISVDNVSLNYALGRVQHWITSERSAHVIITPDALAALRSREDKRYREACAKAGLVLPDGAGLISAFGLLGMPIQERLPGCEFVEHLCELAACSGWKVYFFGGKPGVAEAAADVLKNKYKGLTVAGCRDGYFRGDETPAICSAIKNSGADILFVGLGVPKQEYWLTEHLSETGAAAGMGIGGSMDVISGNLKRAPEAWQKLKLEWLYRTIQEPWRWKRLLGLPVFVFRVLMTKARLDNYKQ